MVLFCESADRRTLQLLSDDEKVILATLEAERAHGPGGKECIVM
jgi:hypothetical protein